jgi:outer membrane protein assembly factor BamB
MSRETLGKYEIRGSLGRGSFAEVLLAWHPVLEAPRALKVPYDQSPDKTSRLAAEARTQAQLTHPHICQVYDTDQAGGTFFIVMEYASGGSLRRALAEGPIGLERALEWFSQAAQALSCAHGRGVVHRDLKPDNLLLSDEGALKVADFGLARILKPTEEARTRAGTFQYMAPEQMKGQATFLSDLWSLGVVFYEILSGRPPFAAESQWALASRIMSAEPEPLGRSRTDLPPPLSDCVGRLLERDPARRTRSADALLEELRSLESLLERSPVLASSPPDPVVVADQSSRQTVALYDWPQARGGPARMGSVSPELVMPLQLAWRTQVGSTVVAPPVVSSGVVLVVTTAGELVLVEEVWGGEVARVELEGSFPAAPSVKEGLAYAGSYSGRLYAVELPEGSVVWEAELGSPAASTPAASGEDLFVALLDGRLLRLDRKSGSVTGNFQAEGALSSPPLVVDDLVLVGSRNHRLYALGRMDLAEKWCFEAGGWIDAGASSSDDGLLVVGSYDGSVTALEAATGAKSWEARYDSWVVASPAVSGGGETYVLAFDGTVAALALEDGSQRWRARSKGRYLGGAALTGEHILVAGAEGLVVALSLADGSEVWSAPIEGECLGGPSVAGRSLYVADREGLIYAFR